MDAYHLQYTLDEDIKFEEKNVQNYEYLVLVYQHFISILYWMPERFKFSGKVKIWTCTVFIKTINRDITIQKNPRILHWLESVLPNIERIRGHLGRGFMK